MSPHGAPIVLWMLFAALLAGCVQDAPADLPRLRLETDKDAVALNEPLEVTVRFVNTLDTEVTVDASRGCIEVQVWVVVEGDALFLSEPGAEDCPGTPRTVTIESGESRTWGPYILVPQDHTKGEEPVFRAGERYRIVADVTGGSTGWSWRNETTVEVQEAKDGLEIEIEPEQEVFDAGQTIRITARLTNTRDGPYTYTSRDGCHDIHVWVEVGDGERGRVRLFPDMEPYFCTQALTEYEIAPGETFEMEVHWDGSRDGRGGAPFVAGGVYTLYAALDGKPDLPSGYGQVGVRSAEG